MRYFVIVLLLIGTIIVAGISTSTIEAIPPLDSQFIYDTSEVILVGRVTSVNSTFSPTHNLYQIEVEKYLKNQLDTDTVLAAGQNTVITKLGNQVFTSGDRVLFFLNNDTIGYDKYTGIFGVSYESKLVEPQWDQCNIFEKSIPAEHWVFGGIGPMPKISQQNNADIENFVAGKKILITYDIFNHTPDEKNIDVGIQIKNLDDPNSLYVYTGISPHLLKACTTYETLSWNFTPTKPGRYSVEFYDLKGSNITIGFTAREQGISKSHDSLSYSTPWEYTSPLKQLKSGIPLEKIQCKEGLELVFKSNDSYPVCVKPETKEKLIQRGWGKNYEDKVTIENYKIDCNYQMNPYQEYECFKNAYSNCQIATVNPKIYTMEGDPVYTNLTITPDCKIQGMADMSTDRFWGVPEIITTKCDAINRDEYMWSVKNCDADNLPEMQFNFEMQLYPKILECEENGNTWNREKLECVVNEENEN